MSSADGLPLAVVCPSSARYPDDSRQSLPGEAAVAGQELPVGQQLDEEVVQAVALSALRNSIVDWGFAGPNALALARHVVERSGNGVGRRAVAAGRWPGVKAGRAPSRGVRLRHLRRRLALDADPQARVAAENVA